MSAILGSCHPTFCGEIFDPAKLPSSEASTRRYSWNFMKAWLWPPFLHKAAILSSGRPPFHEHHKQDLPACLAPLCVCLDC